MTTELNEKKILGIVINNHSLSGGFPYEPLDKECHDADIYTVPIGTKEG